MSNYRRWKGKFSAEGKAKYFDSWAKSSDNLNDFAFTWKTVKKVYAK